MTIYKRFAWNRKCILVEADQQERVISVLFAIARDRRYIKKFVKCHINFEVRPNP